MNRLLGRWKFQGPALGWLETLAVTAVALGLGYWIEPANPLFAGTQFPWPLLAPVLLALRYGVLSGVFSMFLMLVAWWQLSSLGRISPELPRLYFLGGLMLVMLAGEFSGNWQSRLRRQQEVNAYLDEQFSELTKHHYLLRLSHDRLEQAVITRPSTLRESLSRLQELVAQRAEEPLPAAQGFIEFLARYCQLSVAALATFDGERLAESPAASLGGLSAIEPADPLVGQCLATRALAHVQVGAGGPTPSRYLVAAPVATSGGRLLAILLVEKMPFLALQEETLQILAVLLGYYADSAIDSQAALGVHRDLPTCPPHFAHELHKLSRIWREARIPSALVGLSFETSPLSHSVFELIRAQRRASDSLWEVVTAERAALVNLMPLVGSAAVEGYIQRIEEWVQQHVGTSLKGAGVTDHRALLSDEDPVLTVRRLLTACRVTP